MQENCYPCGHVDIATSLISTGNTLRQQGKNDEALDYYQRALKMQEKYYPSDHVVIISGLIRIGNIVSD